MIKTFRDTAFIIKLAIISICIMVVTLTDVSHTFILTDHATYWLSTDEPITVQWDPVENADSYDVIMVWVRGDTAVQVYNIAEDITNTEFTINTAPKTATFVVGVRASNESGDSEYSYSDDPSVASVDGESRSWVLRYYMPSPGPIIISKLKSIWRYLNG